MNRNESKFIDDEPIRRKDCIKLSKLINAKKYIQCSSLSKKSIESVMNSAIKYAYNFKKDKRDHNNNNNVFKIPYLCLLNQIVDTDKVSKEIKNSLSNYNNFINHNNNTKIMSTQNLIMNNTVNSNDSDVNIKKTQT